MFREGHFLGLVWCLCLPLSLQAQQPGCDYDWTGTQYENNCPDSWNGDGSCDCGCQFVDADCGGCPPGEVPDCNGNCAPQDWLGDGSCDDGSYAWNGVPIYFNCAEFGYDNGDCGTSPPPSSGCDYDWTGTQYEGNCPDSWNGAGDGCDCGCQFVDADCGVSPPPSSGCDYDWTGTQYEGNCPDSWNGAGDGCDCGCQFVDADCGTGVSSSSNIPGGGGTGGNGNSTGGGGCTGWCGAFLPCAMLATIAGMLGMSRRGRRRRSVQD